MIIPENITYHPLHPEIGLSATPGARLPDIPVVYFHSVAPWKNQRWVWKYLTLELRFFIDFLEFLTKKRWETIFLEEYHQIRKNGKKLKQKVCCLTFDDGYLDNYIYVWPLLKKYGLKGTIFVSPEFVDLKRDPAQTLEQVWSGKASLRDVDQWGFLTWEEMRIMEGSGHVDIQSHTLTHSKNTVSDKLIGFHYPGSDCIYPLWNLFPEKKPYYIDDSHFETLIPFGYPIFEQRSSVIAKKVTISNEFSVVISGLLQGFDWSQPHALPQAKKKTEGIYQKWKREGRIISKKESENEYQQRITNEIVLSKKIIESNLDKTIRYLCWPHGDNNEDLHRLALSSGYRATTTGSKQKITPSLTRIAQRTAIGILKGNLFLTRLKTRYRMGAASGNRWLKALHAFRQKLG